MATGIEDTLNWYVVHTHPKQEERTNSNLLAWGLETLNPRLRVKRYNQFTGQVIRLSKPLFPSYIFTRFKFNELYHKVRFARGVHSLICFNGKPTPLDEEVVQYIRSRIGSDGFVKTTQELKAGDEVIINEGRFQNLCGVFERELSDADRVSILLNTIDYQAHVVVNKNLISKISPEQRLAAAHAVCGF